MEKTTKLNYSPTFFYTRTLQEYEEMSQNLYILHEMIEEKHLLNLDSTKEEELFDVGAEILEKLILSRSTLLN